MKNFKKILVLALAVIMCLTALSVTAFADTFEPVVSITARFNNEGNRIIASVVTDLPGGAIQGTLTYSGLNFDATSTKFAEANDQVKHVQGENQIKFVLLANDMVNGDTHWADFYFEVPTAESVTFGLTNVSVCDVNETLVEGVSVADVTLALSQNDLRTLGAQYRETNPALRFGTRLDRNAETNALTLIEGATAVRCGFIAGFEFKVGEDTELSAEIDDKGIITSVTAGAINKQAKYCLSSAADHMIYTYAVTGITNDKMTNTGSKDEYIKDLPITARPYVVYVKDGEYSIAFGTQISKSYAEIQAASGLLDATLGYK